MPLISKKMGKSINPQEPETTKKTGQKIRARNRQRLVAGQDYIDVVLSGVFLRLGSEGNLIGDSSAADVSWEVVDPEDPHSTMDESTNFGILLDLARETLKNLNIGLVQHRST